LRGPLKEFQIQHFKCTGAEIVNAVDQRHGIDSGSGDFAGLGGNGRAFGLTELLLGDGGAGKLNGDAIVGVNVIEGAFAFPEGHMHNEHVVVFEDCGMVRFLLDGDGRVFKGFLRVRQENSGKKHCQRKVRSHRNSPSVSVFD
jgi:hypothetical protein